MVGTLEIPKRGRRTSSSVLATILRDAQFWIPVAVLVAGLVVLAWIH
jgi:hypothetical protein